MRLRKYPFLRRLIISVNLDDFGTDPATTDPADPNIPDSVVKLGNEIDLLQYRFPVCPQCRSKDIVRNGTFIRTLETGGRIRIQRYRCNDCAFSFETRPPSYGYGKHYPDGMKEKIVKGGVKTSLRKTAYFFGLVGSVSVSHENIRRTIPPKPGRKMMSSGYLTYNEQYVSIDGKEKFRALLKDMKNGNFVEEILDDLKENTLTMFFTSALRKFRIPLTMTITTDGYHYGSALKETGRILGIRIRRQRCLFHIEKDLLHRIRTAGKEEERDGGLPVPQR